MTDQTLLHVRRRLQVLGVGDDIGRVLVLAYLEQAPAYVDALVNAVARRDVLALRRSLHTLRGSSANLGLDDVVTRCKRLRALVDDRARDWPAEVSDALDRGARELALVARATIATLAAWAERRH